MRVCLSYLVTCFFILLLSNNSCAQVIYNAYANVTNISGATFTVNNVNEINHTFTVNQKVLLIQMQDNVIGTNTTNISSFGNLDNIRSAGLYEFLVVQSVTRSSGTLQTITFSTSPSNSYNIGANSSVQLVTLRNLSTGAFTTTNNITGVAWNGTVGGIVALEVGTDLNLNHNISADNLGFRGGSISTSFSAALCTSASNTVYIVNDGQYGNKGEGIYKNTTASFTYARGKILNGGGGGNHHNAGGGGGGNYTTGGLGGIGYNNCTANPGGGLGGISLAAVSGNRLFMGGGGGGGQQNDNQGSNGGQGGGIILIKASRIVTSGTCGTPLRISANGESPSNSGQDGSGGGGAGGAIYFQVNTYSVVGTCSVNIQVNGGNGASAIHPDVHGGGGPGGQGYVIFSTLQPTTNVLVTANNGTPGCNNNSSPCTSSASVASGTNGSGIQPFISGSCASTNLLYNADFEDPVMTTIGNNLLGIPVWSNWTITPTANFNVIKTNGSVYAGGPNNAQSGTQYIDVTNAAGNLQQSFRLPCTSTISFNGYFSSREQSGGYVNWTGSIQILNSTGSVVATSSTRNWTNADGTEDQIWFQLSGTATLPAGNYTYSAVLGNYANFDNAFLCGTNCFLLPIELVYFNARYNNQLEVVELNWQTSSERNNAYFTVEKSEDGLNWKSIARVTGAGNSKIKLDYNHNDEGKLTKLTYYRLKQTDYDGTTKNFGITDVDPNRTEDEVMVYPNPSNGEINVGSSKLIKQVDLLNGLGELKYSKQPNDYKTIINITTKGVYYLRVILENEVVSRKVIVR